MRGDATPWLRGGMGSDVRHSFRRISRTEAVEAFDNVIIEHGGCETYAVTIRFPSGDETAEVRAAKALRILRDAGADSPFDLALAEAALRSAPLGEEIAVPGDGEDFLQTRLMLTENEVQLVKGPL